MPDTTTRYRQHSGRRSFIRRLFSRRRRHSKVTDPYTLYQERVRPERHRERRHRKVATIVRGVVALILGLLVALALSRGSMLAPSSGGVTYEKTTPSAGSPTGQ